MDFIPKIIHYCWLSNSPIPAEFQNHINSWKKHLPDYEFMLWNFERFDRESSIWVKEAFSKKKYAFAADYIRLYAIYNYGGFYLDMDVEVLKSFDALRSLHTVLCWQDNNEGFEAACFGAQKHSHWIKACLEHYKDKHFIKKNGHFDLTPLPEILESNLNKKAFKFNSVNSFEEAKILETKKIIPIFPSYYFSPKSYKTGKINKNETTYSIHHFAATWIGKYDNLPWYGKIWKFLHLPNTNFKDKIRLLLHLK